MSPDDPHARVPLVRRPDGGWQAGVGPGAVVLAPADGADEETGKHLAPALAGLGLAPGPGSASEEAPACPVVGTGAVAVRLRAALGGLEDETGAPVHVAVHHHAVPPEVGAALARSSTVVLPVVVQPWRVVVGPLAGSPDRPCLHCLDLHRRDRDQAWPTVVSVLGHPVEQVAHVDVPEAVAATVEGLVMLLVSTVLGGGSVSPGAGYEVGRSAPHLVVRRWTVHAGCPWHG